MLIQHGLVLASYMFIYVIRGVTGHLIRLQNGEGHIPKIKSNHDGRFIEFDCCIAKLRDGLRILVYHLCFIIYCG